LVSRAETSGFGFRVEGFGCRLQGSESGVSPSGSENPGLKDSDLGFRVQGSGLRVKGLGWFRVCCLGILDTVQEKHGCGTAAVS